MNSSLTRRTFLAAAVTAPCLLGAASQPATSVNFKVPPEACDCHTHIFGDPAKFPFFAGRTYTPETALPSEMSRLHRALHMKRVVIVTPSVYGTDNSATLYGIKARGHDARGIAVVDERATTGELSRLHAAGFRGIRLNLSTGGVNDPTTARRRLQAAIAQVKPLHWHVQMFTNLPVIAGIREVVLNSEVPIVFDHFGGANASLGTSQPGFSDLMDLVHSGKAYVKISAAYRSSNRPPDYADIAPFAQALIAANPDRVLWGSDWPHPMTALPANLKPTDIAPLLQIDDGMLLNQLAVWAPEAALRKQILVDNPAQLYGF